MNRRKMKEDERPQKKQVVIVAMTSQLLLDITGPADVFTTADKCLQALGTAHGYDVMIVAPTADKKVISETGLAFSCKLCAMDIHTPIDTLVIAGNDYWEGNETVFEPFYTWLSGINEKNTRRITSVCAGAFSLAKVGLLDGRKATTHWNLSEQLKKHYPRIDVDANAFFIHDGPIYTSAGVSSGIDLALALVEEDFGKDIAIKVARHLVYYLSRPGFQAQFGSLLPLYENSNIGQKLQHWLSDHLQEPVDVGKIAAHFNMSVRNLTRVLQKQTGMPPAKFIEKLRVEKARKLLENTDLSLERIAEQSGLGNLISMRRVFLRHLMTTPSDYRRAFRTSLNTPEIKELLPIKSWDSFN
ncbi:transcriptional regulator, AraC family with amidase-like domain [Chitinophaga costaii]|uniref:Transcriptional regulator, AraC family with amidase-like domain n=1 Tax=Chitinophaga costaii TaxID=1335309 RepID=A0A1C4FYF4_9BACT|nr:helix-turn-helix domain-containing protein [Chitinophaga costaii]PUZ20895.1 AraC family transcriptional regulator [Chitinophaga costaii]SCC60625.1 transcriptional regulator, AraC family with amidase-like domain [Chitinophaga costaii]